jgi:hypothetical protein
MGSPPVIIHYLRSEIINNRQGFDADLKKRATGISPVTLNLFGRINV